MLQMFRTDLYTADAVSLGTFDFGIGFYGSFDSKSLFISLFLPGGDHANDIISWFSYAYHKYLDDARKNIHIWTAPQGDQSQPISDDLNFTNRIYVYYENILSDAQVNALTALYRANGLDPVFRGLGYLENRRLRIAAGQDKMPIDVTPTTPSAILDLPALQASPQYINGHKLPSLLSLFMTDFKGVGAIIGSWTDYGLSQGSKERKERVPIHLYADIHNHKQFVAFYIPPSNFTYTLVKSLASDYAARVRDLNKTVVIKTKDGSGPFVGPETTFVDNPTFSGDVYLYISNGLTDSEMEELRKAYTEHGASLIIRDFGYVLERWKRIQSGQAEMPPDYRLNNDNLPELVQ